MNERDGQPEMNQPEPAGAYEPPALTDLETIDGPSVTAAGTPTVTLAAPRKL
jgi:hypothetical protein